MEKCRFPKDARWFINGHAVDPCLYEETEKYVNVTVIVNRCKKCGHIEIEWVPQENTERIL